MRRVRAGIATKIAGYGGMLAGAAALWGIALKPAFDKSLAAANNTTDIAELSTGTEYAQQAGEWVMLFVLLIGMVGLIAAAVFRSQRGL